MTYKNLSRFLGYEFDLNKNPDFYHQALEIVQARFNTLMYPYVTTIRKLCEEEAADPLSLTRLSDSQIHHLLAKTLEVVEIKLNHDRRWPVPQPKKIDYLLDRIFKYAQLAVCPTGAPVPPLL